MKTNSIYVQERLSGRRFMLISAKDEKDLCEEVNEAVTAGWHLHGPIMIVAKVQQGIGGMRQDVEWKQAIYSFFPAGEN
ncbi:DUF1737 domain-containing protein [candidate division KSB1 bacterium]|nr:MAG: DUF1737 domain-containing protein [candidate division KSB1 bacterium]